MIVLLVPVLVTVLVPMLGMLHSAVMMMTLRIGLVLAGIKGCKALEPDGNIGAPLPVVVMDWSVLL